MISATIRALSSWLHFRRRPVPVKTSSRRTGSVIAICSVSILSLTVKTKPKTRRSAHHLKGGRKTPLTLEKFGTDEVRAQCSCRRHGQHCVVGVFFLRG